MTEKEFTEISLTVGLTFGISYMLFIVYKLAEESKAGRLWHDDFSCRRYTYSVNTLNTGIGTGSFLCG